MPRRSLPPDMPFALALVASALIHAAALLGPGWSLPGQDEPEAMPLNALLAPPVEPAAAVVPAAQTRPKPPAKPAMDKPPAVTAAPVHAATEHATAVPPVPESLPPTTEAIRAATLATIALPQRGQVRYVISKGESGSGMVVGQSVHTWEHDDRQYTLKSVSQTTGLAALLKPARVVQSSHGEVITSGLRPSIFRHERAGGEVDTAAFDEARHVVAYAGREDAFAVGTQDMLSMYYQLVLHQPGTQAIDMPIATGRKLESYHFEIVGPERITLADGTEHAATHLSAKSGGDRIDVWVAADVHSLPLKIRFIDRQGDIFDQVMDALEPKVSHDR